MISHCLGDSLLYLNLYLEIHRLFTCKGMVFPHVPGTFGTIKEEQWCWLLWGKEGYAVWMGTSVQHWKPCPTKQPDVLDFFPSVHRCGPVSCTTEESTWGFWAWQTKDKEIFNDLKKNIVSVYIWFREQSNQRHLSTNSEKLESAEICYLYSVMLRSAVITQPFENESHIIKYLWSQVGSIWIPELRVHSNIASVWLLTSGSQRQREDHLLATGYPSCK